MFLMTERREGPRTHQEYDLRKPLKDLLVEFTSPEDHRGIALEFIEAKKSLDVIDNLSKFEGLNQEVALKLIEAAMRDKFKNVALSEIINNLYKFSGPDNNEVALKLIEEGEGWLVAGHIDKFHGLDEEVLQRLSQKRSTGWPTSKTPPV